MPPSDEYTDSTVPNLLFSGSSQSSFACNTCKKKKIRCDRVAPQCGHCTKANRNCEYPLSVPKPGPKAGFASRKRQLPLADGDEVETGKGSLCDRNRGPETDANGNVINDSIIEITHPKHRMQEPGSSQWEPERHMLNGDLSGSSAGHSRGIALNQALNNLDISWQDCEAYIDTYFENMTAYSLFHRPSFERKLASITSPSEIEALLTAMIAFAKSFGNHGKPSAIRNLPSWAIWERARCILRDCLDYYDEETPPLHVLQTMLLTTWNQLYQGVHSKGWRAVGEVVRICYEMRLHQEDDGRQWPRSWIEREERRRAWYVAWELDVFTSTMKRLPTAIDWCTNRTKLPVTDSNWFSGVGGESCLFSLEPSERWKKLEKTGNTSPMAWFVIINSYKYEAYLLSTHPLSCSLRFAKEERVTPEAIRKHRDMLINCVHCTQLALPETLALRDRFLSFRSADRFDDAWRYTIHHMFQVTKFMLYRIDILFQVDVFFRPRPNPDSNPKKAPRTNSGLTKLAWDQLIASGDESVRCLRNSASDHIRYVNPFIANAIWFCAAALAVGLVLGPAGVDRKLLVTNFDMLRGTVKEFTRTSRVPETLVSSLDTLEENLQALTDRSGATHQPTTLNAAVVPANESDSPHMTSASRSESARSPFSAADAEHGRAILTPNSEGFQSGMMPPPDTDAITDKDLNSVSMSGANAPMEMGYFDTPGLDMTQSFADLESLWSTTADWGFNIDPFRIPFE